MSGPKVFFVENGLKQVMVFRQQLAVRILDLWIINPQELQNRPITDKKPLMTGAAGLVHPDVRQQV